MLCFGTPRCVSPRGCGIAFCSFTAARGRDKKNRTSADVRAYLNCIRNCILIQFLFVSKSYFILYCIRYCIQPLSSLTGVAVSFPGRNRGHLPRNCAQFFSGTAFSFPRNCVQFSPEPRSVFSGTALSFLWNCVHFPGTAFALSLPGCCGRDPSCRAPRSGSGK